MILHVVLFRPRAGLSHDERNAIMRSVQEAAAEIPTIRRLRIGRRTRHGLPGYEQAMGEDYEYVLVAEFEDKDGLTRYLTHPAHASLGRHFTTSADAALAYDFEIVKAEDSV